MRGKFLLHPTDWVTTVNILKVIMIANLTPPTDNLYKFMAIFGLLLVLTSVIYPVQKTIEFYEDIDSMHAEFDVLSTQRIALQEYTDTLVTKKPLEINKKELEEKKVEANIISLKLNSLNSKVQRTASLYDWLFKLTQLTLASGFFIMFLGFILWLKLKYEVQQKNW